MLGIGGATIVLAALPFGPAASGDTAGLYGFTMNTSATALMMTYDSPSAGLPAKPTFEVRKVYSVAALDSGPSGRALASIAWPGDLIGNAPPELALDSFTSDPTTAEYLEPTLAAIRDGGCLPTGTCMQGGLRQSLHDNCTAPDGSPPSGTGNPCTYPVRAESFYPQGPKETRNDTGLGAGMRSKAESEVTEAAATMQRAGFPSAFSLGAMNSSAFSGIVKDQAISEARTHISDINLLGQIQIQSLNSYAKAVSDGVTATLEGSVVVGGLTIGGQGFTIDGKGLHYPNGAQDPYGTYAKKYVDEQLKPQGIDITIVQPFDVKQGPAASRAVSGLIITLDSVGMRRFINSLPQDGPLPIGAWIKNPLASPLAPAFEPFKPDAVGLLLGPTRFDGTMKIILGNIGVDTNASPPFELPDITPPDVITPPVVFPPSGPIDVGPVVGPPSVAPPPAVPTFNTVPVALVKGLNGGLVGGIAALLGLLGALFLPRAADRLWVAKPVARCPLESSE
jgi:hypothetical protein